MERLWDLCESTMASTATTKAEAVLQNTDGMYFSNDNKMFLYFSSDIWHLIIHNS